jgi:protein arginine N-methyltransferase 2
MATMTSTATAQGTSLNNEKVRTMIEACSAANMPTIQQLMRENSEYACQQDESTGISPLMAASKAGHLELVHMLLDEGAPWNAIDRNGQCAGNYATDAEQWNVVNLMVEWGTRSELILGEIQRSQRQHVAPAAPAAPAVSSGNIPVEHHSSTKPDYLSHRLRYNSDNTALLDADDDAVMMEWERPLMKAHAQILTGEAPGKRVMNVGFGMGIIDTALQEYNPSLHIIIEAHPDVYQRMLDQKWDQKPNVKLCHGRWQDVLPQLIREGVELDGVFFDTYAEHSFDMEDFHVLMSQILSKPQGVYSFFNGLAPDNLFFHGVGKLLSMFVRAVRENSALVVLTECFFS